MKHSITMISFALYTLILMPACFDKIWEQYQMIYQRSKEMLSMLMIWLLRKITQQSTILHYHCKQLERYTAIPPSDTL